METGIGTLMGALEWLASLGNGGVGTGGIIVHAYNPSDTYVMVYAQDDEVGILTPTRKRKNVSLQVIDRVRSEGLLSETIIFGNTFSTREFVLSPKGKQHLKDLEELSSQVLQVFTKHAVFRFCDFTKDACFVTRDLQDVLDFLAEKRYITVFLLKGQIVYMLQENAA